MQQETEFLGYAIKCGEGYLTKYPGGFWHWCATECALYHDQKEAHFIASRYRYHTGAVVVRIYKILGETGWLDEDDELKKDQQGKWIVKIELVEFSQARMYFLEKRLGKSRYRFTPDEGLANPYARKEYAEKAAAELSAMENCRAFAHLVTAEVLAFPLRIKNTDMSVKHCADSLDAEANPITD